MTTDFCGQPSYSSIDRYLFTMVFSVSRKADVEAETDA